MEKKAEDAKEPLNPMSYESLRSFTIFDVITYACTATSVLRGGWKDSIGISLFLHLGYHCSLTKAGCLTENKEEKRSSWQT